MAEQERVFVEKRGIGRREEDHQAFKYRQISRVGQIIISEMNLENLLDLIMDQTVQIIGAKRCTVFLYDSKADQLWSKFTTGMQRNRIRMPSNAGAAGWVFKNREPLIIDDAYSDHRFYSRIDKETGFLTKNILCIPLINKSDNCIGALQVLNKISGDFTQKDIELLISISHYISIALENANLYEGLKTISEAREKVIDHLSHELRTPVAIIDAALERISKVLAEDKIEKIDRPIIRCRRNLKRLTYLQEKITDILNYRIVDDKERISHLIETFFSLTEEISEENRNAYVVLYEKLLQRLESIYRTEEFHRERIKLKQFLRNVHADAVEALGGRDLEIICDVEHDLVLTTGRLMLKKVCEGLLKNAIEATPDDGKIRVDARRRNGSIAIDFQDWGVGITPDNQKNIFNGFYHTQDTDYYASKKPYAFYAGGSGSDLLRIKVFSERYGFSIGFTSSCCRFIPGVKNMCPGRISQCRFITDPSECFASGGSTFSLEFPLGRDPESL